MTSEDTGPLLKACHAKTWPQVNLKKSSVVNRIPLWVKPCSEFQLAVFWVCSSCHFLTTRLPDSSQGVMRKSRNRGKRAAKEFMFFYRLLEICHVCSDIRVFFFFFNKDKGLWKILNPSVWVNSKVTQSDGIVCLISRMCECCVCHLAAVGSGTAEGSHCRLVVVGKGSSMQCGNGLTCGHAKKPLLCRHAGRNCEISRKIGLCAACLHSAKDKSMRALNSDFSWRDGDYLM